MGRPEQDDNGRFEGGIFSGMPSKEPERDQECHTNSVNYRPEQDKRYRCPYGCVNCPNNSRSNYTAFIVVAVAAIIALLIAFLVTLFCLLHVVSAQKEPAVKGKNTYNYGYETIPYQDVVPGTSEGSQPIAPFEDWIGKEPKTEAGGEEEYYGEIRDAVRTDLDYSIEWENYEYEGNNDSIMIVVDYPVIKGEVPNRDILNEIIEDETEYFEEYYDEYSKYMLPEETFGVYSEGYVTYMDAEVMSVVFCETIYTDYWVDCGLFCVNIDMENGIVLSNNSIVDINDEFAVDFRSRSREQNGNVSALDYMTDQEIAYYLTNAGTSILFYTPLGMEIGLNYGESYVTVTYKDYGEFLQKY